MMQPQKFSHLILILLCFYQKVKRQKLIQTAFELFLVPLGNCLTCRPGPQQAWSSPATLKSANSHAFTPANDLCLHKRQKWNLNKLQKHTHLSHRVSIILPSLHCCFTSFLTSPAPGISNFFPFLLTDFAPSLIPTPFLLQRSPTWSILKIMPKFAKGLKASFKILLTNCCQGGTHFILPWLGIRKFKDKTHGSRSALKKKDQFQNITSCPTRTVGRERLPSNNPSLVRRRSSFPAH